MDNEPQIIPQPAVKGIATGLFMMAFFTLIWSGIAFGGLHNGSYWPLLLIFAVVAVVFVINGIKLFRIAKYFPKLTSETDIAAGKKMSKWFGTIFAAEGLGIFIGINVVINLGHPELTMPVIALVVGLHFFPLAKVFKRTVDYYLASWSTLVAIAAIVLSLNKTFDEAETFAFVGIGIAIATSCYGIYMVMRGMHARRQLPVVDGKSG